MIETAPVPTGTDPRPRSRRRFLTQAGGLAALTALTGTGVLSWRTATQGVLAPPPARRTTPGGSSTPAAASRLTW